MSRIQSIAHGNGLFSLRLDDGSVFHMDEGDDHNKCDEAWFGNDEEEEGLDIKYISYDKAVVTIEFQDDSIPVYISVLPDGNYESCQIDYLNETNSGCKTIQKNSGNAEFLDFFINSKAYALGGCSLLVEHKGCADFVY